MDLKRPDGGVLINIGFVLLAGSLLLFVLSMVADAPEAQPLRSLATLVSASALVIAVPLLAVGWIVRAIYFLPGRDPTNRPD